LLPSPTQVEYNLNVKVFLKTHSFEDVQSRGSLGITQTTSVVLEPCFEETQAQKFLMAWLPEVPGERHEIVCSLLYPIFQHFRGSLTRANDFWPKPHIFVMNLGTEIDLKGYVVDRGEGAQILLTVHPESSSADEDFADSARDAQVVTSQKTVVN
jgi:hypothetical protein